MNQKNTRLSVCCLVVGLILTTVLAAMSAFAAESLFRITGTVILEGDEGDTPLEGARISAIKCSATTHNESEAATATSAADGGYTLDIPVDTDLGGSDIFNKVQIRLMGPAESDDYVTVCSPFLELLYLPTGYFNDYELIPITLGESEAVLAAIFALGEDYAVDRTKGILVRVVEIEDGDDISGLPGIQFTLTSYPDGAAIDGVRTVYQAADGSWKSQIDRTTTMGAAVIYNIPLGERGWRDVSLTPSEIDGYRIGTLYWTRVYAYESGDEHRITLWSDLADEIISPEEDTGDDDDGGGGCFIATAMS